MSSQRISPDRLRTFASAAYVTTGLSEDRAALCADTLVQADLWGHQSHGVIRLSWYMARLRAGVCDPLAEPELVVYGGALAVLDCQEAMGQISAARAASSCRSVSRRSAASCWSFSARRI